MTNKGMVAIVDDDRRVLQSIGSLLESVGYTVTLFASAELLLSSTAVNSIACVISDIGIPGVDGIELKALLSEREPDLPVILITGNRKQARRTEVKDLDPPYFFEKPYNTRELLEAVGKLSRKV
ncbi:MAG TPA: response regulator [Acidobacteriaceae bacterium]|nr:response regulator [Acidobacteriaceae bacterium]